MTRVSAEYNYNFQVLHIFWFYLISKIAASALRGDKVEDNRSDIEEDSSDDDKTK